MSRAHYKKIVDALAADIRAGRLRPSTRLPTHRDITAHAVRHADLSQQTMLGRLYLAHVTHVMLLYGPAP